MVILQFEVEGLLGPILNSTLDRRHFIAPQARDDPLQALMRQNLDLQADKLDFLRVCKVPVSLVDYAVVDSPVDCFQGGASVDSHLLLHLLDELRFEDQKVAQRGILE